MFLLVGNMVVPCETVVYPVRLGFLVFSCPFVVPFALCCVVLRSFLLFFSLCCVLCVVCCVVLCVVVVLCCVVVLWCGVVCWFVVSFFRCFTLLQRV